MQTIRTKKGNVYYVIYSSGYKQDVIDITKYAQGIYNARDVRSIDCKPEELPAVLDKYGF